MKRWILTLAAGPRYPGASHSRTEHRGSKTDRSRPRLVLTNGLVAIKPELSASVQCESWDCAFESGTRRVKPYVVSIVSGATVSSLASRQARRSKEHCLHSGGSLVLHVWKNVSISIQRKGCARMSKLLRNNFGRHSGCQRDSGRRIAQIIEPQSWDTRQVDY